MKPFITPLLLGLGLCQAVLGGPSPLYQNNGFVTNVPVVDALVFWNAGYFDVDTESVTVNLPYMTRDTLYFTNSPNIATMEGLPGFRFDTGTATTRHSAASFFNAGTVEGVDIEGFPYLWSPPGSPPNSPVLPVPALSQPYASQIQVLATNIVNTATMSVGTCGLLRLVGNNVTNTTFAILTAGSVNTIGLSADPLDTTGLEGQTAVFGDGVEYYTGSPGVYDLFWAATNGGVQIDAAGLASGALSSLPTIPITLRGGPATNAAGGTNTYSFALNPNPPWSVSVYSNSPDGSNFYYNMVFVNTNFSGANISAAVGFTPTAGVLQVAPKTAYVTNAYEGIVQFTEPVVDVTTGETVTNGFYLLDDGAYLLTMSNVDNASSPDGYSRPNAFAVTTETPSDWYATIPGNSTYDPTVFYVPQEFVSNTPSISLAEYGAQIGRNPAVASGAFNFSYPVSLPDPTNDPGRIEISAGNLDVTSGLMRAEGIVVLNVSNLAGLGTAGVDWPEINATIGVKSGEMVVSNVFPASFNRVRGDVFAWSATWENLQTNNAGGNTNVSATNLFHYHILVVDQALVGSMPSVVQNLTLTGKKSINVQDTLYVGNQAVFNTTNLNINSTVYFSPNVENFMPSNTPFMKNLLIGPNGLLEANDLLDVGFNVNGGQAAPAGRTYTVNTLTNFGIMEATTTLLQSGIVENDGIIFATDGSMIIEANEVGLGLAQTEATNLLYAAGNVSLSANTILAQNSFISSGGSLGLYATERLTDFVSGTPTTNTNSVITNFWTVGGGFSMPVKPGVGDLYGTEIHTIASGFQQVWHVWAGTDLGSNVTGGTLNDEVIGRLVLDRQTASSILRFSAAGTKNAMYVDYLELTNYAFSNYHTGLSVDPNFTIYFANCNLDPEKVMEVYYPRVVWMTNFVGPNSAQVVPFLGSTNVCLMNAGVAQSTEISFFPGTGYANFYNPNYPDILNNPNNPSLTANCPSSGSSSNPGVNEVQILTVGEGGVASTVQPANMVLGKSYTLTAKPSMGWVFENWTTIGLPGTVNTNTAVLPFTFLTNTIITANFVPNPFGGLHGVYNGLFFESNAVSPVSSGAFSLTLQPTGSFSGHLLMGPLSYSFSSQFTGDGVAQAQAVNGAKKLAVHLQLDVSGQTGQILGDVNGGAWDSPLEADFAPVWSVQNPSPLTGSYTMVLPWDTGTYDAPGGDSFATGTVSKLGVLAVGGTLADGAAFSASAPVSQFNRWPFYTYAASGKDSILGWVWVTNGLSSTNVTWYKGAGNGPLYPAGFSSVLQLAGSPWQAPARGFPALTLLNPQVMLSGGGLPESLTIGVALENFLSYTATNLSLSIKPSGGFSGWFEAPGSVRKQTISGVVLQNSGTARGLFLGPNASGAVWLEGQ